MDYDTEKRELERRMEETHREAEIYAPRSSWKNLVSFLATIALVGATGLAIDSCQGKSRERKEIYMGQSTSLRVQEDRQDNECTRLLVTMSQPYQAKTAGGTTTKYNLIHIEDKYCDGFDTIGCSGLEEFCAEEAKHVENINAVLYPGY